MKPPTLIAIGGSPGAYALGCIMPCGPREGTATVYAVERKPNVDDGRALITCLKLLLERTHTHHAKVAYLEPESFGFLAGAPRLPPDYRLPCGLPCEIEADPWNPDQLATSMSAPRVIELQGQIIASELFEKALGNFVIARFAIQRSALLLAAVTWTMESISAHA